jgi:hypothetical protein
MKYILVELPNNIPDDLVEGLADNIRTTLKSFVTSTSIVRFGSLHTSR